MIQQEICEKTKSVAELEQSLKNAPAAKDEYDGRSVIVEVRSGVGGEEAALFAHSLVRMYSMYAQAHRWQMELLNLSETELGGVREAVFAVNGQGAYSRLNLKAGCTASSVCPTPRPRAASTPPPRRWRCCPRPTRWTWSWT